MYGICVLHLQDILITKYDKILSRNELLVEVQR